MFLTSPNLNKNHKASLRTTLLCAFVIILLSFTPANAHPEEQHYDKVWRIVSARDDLVRNVLQSRDRAPYPEISYSEEKRQVSVSGICNSCTTNIDTIAFGCSRMACQEDIMKAEDYVLKTLEGNGLAFLQVEQTTGGLIVDGNDGKSIKLEILDGQAYPTNGHGHGGRDGDDHHRKGKKNNGSILEVLFVCLMGVLSFLMV